MIRFLLAFALGVFVGSAAAVYFSSPDAYGRLKAAKRDLLGGASETSKPAAAEPAPPPTVAAQPQEREAPSPEPEPESEPEPAPAPDRTLGDKAKDAIDKSATAASELARKGKEKAEPYVDDGIDLAIATAIRAQYKLERDFPSASIDITVVDREVTLAGRVPDTETEQRAISIALETKGVRWVESKLAVAP